MAEIADIGQTDTGCGQGGGVLHSYGVDNQWITAVTVGASNEITGFTMSDTGKWGKYTYDDDDAVAAYTETSNDNGTVTQQLTANFNGLSQAKIKALNDAKACCGTTWVHVLNDGTRIVQGIQVDTAGNWAFANSKAVVRPASNTQTRTDTNPIATVNINSEAAQLSVPTTVNDAAIEAL